MRRKQNVVGQPIRTPELAVPELAGCGPSTGCSGPSSVAYGPDGAGHSSSSNPKQSSDGHRRGFRLSWRWKSRRRGPGRPRIPRAVRALIREMCLANPTWGAPRIHGELLKLGIEIAESTVGQYLVRRRPPPSQTWRTFPNNHVDQLASVDFFVVPTLTFRVLWVFVVLAHDRRRILHVNVTGHPTAEWTAQQIRNAFPWDTAPRFLLRDRDGIYGPTFRACLDLRQWRSTRC